MNLKWMGAVLIVGGCGGFGFLMAWNISREVAALRRLIGILDYMSCELEYRMTPLPELLRKATVAQGGSVKEALTALAEELESQIAPDVSSCMKAALRKTPELPKRVRMILQELGISLGAFDLPGQLKGLDAVRQNCSLALSELEQNRVQRTRSYQTLGLCAGAALAILFI